MGKHPWDYLQLQIDPIRWLVAAIIDDSEKATCLVIFPMENLHHQYDHVVSDNHVQRAQMFLGFNEYDCR